MEALEKLAQLLVQQHSLQPSGRSSGGQGEAAAAAAAAPGGMGAGEAAPQPDEAAETMSGVQQQQQNTLAGQQGLQEQLSQPPQAADTAAPAAHEGSAAGSGNDLGAALASLLQQHQQLLQQQKPTEAQPPPQQPQQQQLPAQMQVQLPAADAAAFDASRHNSADMTSAAAMAALSAVPAAGAGGAGGGGDETARALQLELAKAVAQVVITMLQKHPTCAPLKHMGAAISEVLLKAVAPSGLNSLATQMAQPLATALQPPQQQQAEQGGPASGSTPAQHMLLAALLQPALGAPGGNTPSPSATADAMLLRHLAGPHTIDGAGSGTVAHGSSGTDVLLAAALQEHLQPAWQQDQLAMQQQPQQPQLYRPQPVRAPSQQQVGGATDQATTTRAWPQLVQSVPHGLSGGGSQVRTCLGSSAWSWCAPDHLESPHGCGVGSVLPVCCAAPAVIIALYICTPTCYLLLPALA